MRLHTATRRPGRPSCRRCLHVRCGSRTSRQFFLRDDPALKTKPEVTILTSGVDVNNVYQHEGQNVYFVDQGIGKLKAEMAKTPDKNYTIAFFEDDKFEPLYHQINYAGRSISPKN